MPTDQSTIDEFIDDYRDREVSMDTLHYKEINEFPSGESIMMLTDTILSKFKADLDEIIETKTFTTQEQTRYYCNPWYLSYDLYGTTEFWFLLLDLNDMHSAIEFTRNPIKVYDASLPDVVNEIIALSEEKVELNNDEVEEDTSQFAEAYYEEDDDDMEDEYEEEDDYEEDDDED